MSNTKYYMIATTGTSIVENYFGDRNVDTDSTWAKLKAEKDFQNGVTNIKGRWKNGYDSLINKVKEWALGEDNPAAELKTLELFAKKPNTEVTKIFLLHSHTIDGLVAAEVLAMVINQRSPNIKVELKLIDDLNVKEAARLESTGFQNFIGAIHNIYEEKEKTKGNEKIHQIVFNSSGGYKVLLPLMGTIAQIKGSNIYYAYEHSEELCEIKHLPVYFDNDLLVELLPALKIIQNQKNQKDVLVPQGYRDVLLDSNLIQEYNVERDGTETKDVKLTNLGLIMSSFAWKDLEESDSNIGFLMEYKFMEYFLKNPLDGSYSVKERSFNIGVDNDQKKREIDIALENGSNELVFCESKALRVFKENDGLKMEEQLKGQIEAWKASNKCPKKFVYLIYAYAFLENYLKDHVEIQKIIENLKAVEGLGQTELDYRMCYVRVKINIDFDKKDPHQKENPYKQLFSQKLKWNNKYNVFELEKEDKSR